MTTNPQDLDALQAALRSDGPVFAYGELFRRADDAITTLRRDLLAAEAAATERAAHSDDQAVDRFAAAMKAKLAKKRAEGRGGWERPDCTADFLSALLREHVEKGDPLDVGNLAMMIHQRGEKITPEATTALDAVKRAEYARGLRDALLIAKQTGLEQSEAAILAMIPEGE